MSAAKRPPRVVAELGRPETPEETAARKARDSALYRQRKTVNNLILSLIVSLAMVLVIVLAVPRGNYDPIRSVDVVEIAEAAQPIVDMPLAVPELGEGWRSTKAEIRESAQQGITFWYVGYITPDDQFAAFKQALGANPSWIAQELQDRSPTGTETRNGVEWIVYDYQELSPDVTNVRLGLTTVAGDVTYVVYGTASLDDMWLLADQIADHIQATLTATAPTDSETNND